MARRLLAAAGRLAAWALAAAAVAALLAYGAAYLAHIAAVVRFPYQVDYGEMPELNRAWLLARGRPIYGDWSQPPYQMANYPPLYSLLNAVGVFLLGPQFLTGRLLSAAGALVAAGCLVWVTYRAGGERWRAGVAGLLFLTGHYVWDWSGLLRVDLLALALTLLGVAIFVEGYVAHGRAWGVWLALPCFLGAVYTRQTMVAGAFACFVYLLLRNPRLAARAVGAYAAGGLALLAALQLASDGQFLQHVVVGNLNRFSWDRVHEQWLTFRRLYHWTLPFAGAFLVSALVTTFGRRVRSPLLLYLGGAVAVGLTVGKVGSNVNYLVEAWAALTLAVALGWAALDALARRAASRLGWEGWIRVLPALFFLAGLQQAYHVPYTHAAAGPPGGDAPWAWLRSAYRAVPLWRLDPWGRPPASVEAEFPTHFLPDPSAADARLAAQVERRVRAAPGDVLAEEMDSLVTTGKRIYLQPFEFAQLAEQGLWDQRPLLAEIQAGRFPLVILRFPLDGDPGWHRERFTAEMLAAIGAAYEHEATLGDYYLYVPRGQKGS